MTTDELSADHLKEIEREARAMIARRTVLGALSYPVTAFLLGWVAEFHLTEPRIFYAFVVVQLVLGIVRLMMVWNFDSLYDRGSWTWSVLFRPVLLATSVVWSLQMAWILLETGFSHATFLGMVIGAVKGSIATIVFTLDVILARLFLFIVIVPMLLTLVIQGGSLSYVLSIATVIFVGYLVLEGRRFHEEAYNSLVRHKLLKQRATELEKARDAEKAANQAKGLFLANMSHEMRTPMNAVIGLAEVLLDSELGEEQRDWAATIKRSGDSLLFLINDLLDFSKIESGEVKLEEQTFHLSECLEGAMTLVQYQASRKGLAVSLEIEPSCPERLVADPSRLRQVFLNLLSNAIKFTSEGRVDVTVSARRCREADKLGDHELQFAVRDTGIGFPPERIEELFEPFRQADTSTSRRYGGTGLGLAICRRLIDIMGGRIWAKSTPGVGSTFFFTIRVGQATSDPSADWRCPVVSKDAYPATDPSRLEKSDLAVAKPLRILLAEDNIVNQKVAALLLRKLGHDVDIVGDGLDVLVRLSERDFDVILMDVRMPELDGVETTRRIRQGQASDLPWIIALTAEASGGDRDKCLDAGMNDYLSKPVSLKELADALGRVPPGLEAEHAG